MKQSIVLAAACALALSACGGGGKAQIPVHVTVTGVVYDGLVLTTNGQDLPVPPANTGKQLTFPNTLSYGDVYDITVKTQPAHQTCTPYAFTHDSAGHFASIDAIVTCLVQPHALSGTITGLTGSGLVLTNGSMGGTAAPAAGATTFSLNSVQYGTTYGVTVLTQPSGQTCTVQKGVGTMGDAAVTDVAVTCQ